MSFENIDDVFPLSAVQAGMLYHCLESNTERAYVSHITFTLHGELDLDIWKHAWKKACDRHDALRASFIWDGLDDPLQMINATADLEWCVIDLRGIEKSEQIKQISDSLEQQHHTGMSLNSSPLMRFTMHQVSESDWQVIWTIHHLLADGWSTPLILKSVLSLYAEQEELPPAPAYANYIAWERKRDHSKAMRWWQTHLSGAVSSPLRILPPDTVNAEPRVPYITSDLTAVDAAALQEFLKKSGLTLATLVHAAWAFTVSAYSGSNQPLFGTAVSGRHPEMPSSEDTVGLFLKTVPLMVDVDASLSRSEFLQRLQLLLVACNAHDVISLVKLNQLIDSSEASSVFESIVVIEGHANDLQLSDPGAALTIDSIEYSTHSNYPLALLAFPGERLKFKLIYDEGFIDESACTKLMQHFGMYFNSLINSDNLSVGDCLDTIKAPASPVSEKVTPLRLLLHEWINVVAQYTPDSAAIVCAGESISYAELDKQSNQVANLILQQNLSDSMGIGLYLPRSLEQIIALLGVLKSGHYYVPLDTEAPVARTEMLISLAGCQFILGSGKPDAALTQNTEMLDVNQRHDYSAAPVSAGSPDDTAYVMFTSGSTGQPKRVAVSHRNLAYSTAARLQYYGESASRYLLLSSIAFDSSVAGIYWTLCSGGTLVLPKPSEEKELPVLADLIFDHKITHTLGLPSLYSLLLENTDPSLLASLRTVIVAGEACKAHVVNQHFSLLPDTALYNEYGPTEATVWSTVHRVSRTDTADVPIGEAIPGSEVRLIGQNGKPCPDGVIGEIQISGPGVTDTDISKASNNALTYLTGDLGVRKSSGEILYLGRKDRQLKVRGFRIEPTEIENALLEVKEISEAVVVAKRKRVESVSEAEIERALKKLPAEVADEYLAAAQALSQRPFAAVHSKS